MSTIVVGYDDSEAARRALSRAGELAQPLRAGLVVVAVAEMLLSPEFPSSGELLDGAPMSVEPIAPPAVEEALASARQTLAARGLEADFVWAAGEPAGTLLDIAEDRGADVIVIGTHHESLLARLFGASVTDEVTRGAACDVLVVR